MKILRSVAMTLVFGLSIFAGLPVHAQGIPTYDNASFLSNLKEFAETAIRYGQQIENWKQQYGTQVEQLNQVKSGNYSGLIGKLTGGALDTSASATLVGSNAPESFGAAAASKYLNDDYNKCSSGGDTSSANYKACIGERNTQAAALAEMDRLLKQINTRASQVEGLVAAASSEKTQGEMQLLQLQLTGYQTLMQTDMNQLQLTMAMYKQRTELYRQQQADTARRIIRGTEGSKSGAPIPLAF